MLLPSASRNGTPRTRECHLGQQRILGEQAHHILAVRVTRFAITWAHGVPGQTIRERLGTLPSPKTETISMPVPSRLSWPTKATSRPARWPDARSAYRRTLRPADWSSRRSPCESPRTGAAPCLPFQQLIDARLQIANALAGVPRVTRRPGRPLTRDHVHPQRMIISPNSSLASPLCLPRSSNAADSEAR